MAKPKKSSANDAGATTAKSGGEVQVSKSPAEFFAENQAIAGFDNMGRSLYTSIRELVENALDACESINELPDIRVSVEEFTQAEFNEIRGLHKHGKGKREERMDAELFQKKSSKGKGDTEDADGKKLEGYFRIKVRDNGCGMRHDDIPNLLGRVLSGSKYGVRQTRGKFGLGAKMALIWSKKSTGVPIRITTAHRPNGGSTVPSKVSTCVLDIDIYKNRPRIIEHTLKSNKEWKGTEMEIMIGGNWSSYKNYVVKYLQQLAIITPYARLEMTYTKAAETSRAKDMTIAYERRSDQMPPPAREVKHHPSSVNNLLIAQLLERTQTKTMVSFLSKELAAVPQPLAKRLLAELGDDFSESMSPSSLDDKQVTRLVQLLRSVQQFKAPDGSCLSPLGEYNLNLGIQKVLEPTMVATARDKAEAYEGHPFIVEAAVSLGGKSDIAKEGITVVRFANRIPLLFEGGADVSSRVAHKKISWGSYKIDYKRDKIGVFVSIVSTKIPYKGTGKEYIGDDITEIQKSVRRAIQNCCLQLKKSLTKRNAIRDNKEKRSRLIKYIPDVSRALFGLLDGMRQRKRGRRGNDSDDDEEDVTARESPLKKKLRLDSSAANVMIRKLERKEVTADTIKADLVAAVEKQMDETLEDGDQGTTTGAKKGGSKNANAISQNLVPIFLLPLNLEDQDPSHDIRHPLFTFRPFKPMKHQLLENKKEDKNGDHSDSVQSVVSLSD
ncbi:topoisomerase 6 subunit B [Seminavis robusta]|uniref:Topoisomerase 6 subunit B n=1 Tax=Seminavis robusta TaxID=568900 RepID=A0A9N8EP81_9STRA|nr:topoisomerase 6 subunit B [Seminavis robusta]|eukprot:Sro1577_g283570.1 topoisomerase 6 subunit B (724) ;mRNA; f:7960-10596